MTPAADSVGANRGGDVIAPTASSLRKRALDGAASAASAAPREADAVQPVAAELRTPLAQFDSADGDVVAHRQIVAQG